MRSRFRLILHSERPLRSTTVDLGLERLATRPGTHARFRYSGKLANIGLAYHRIYGAYRERARESGYVLGIEPALCMFDAAPSGAGAARVLIAVPMDVVALAQTIR